MRYVAIVGVLGLFATHARAEHATYRLALISDKSVQGCSRGGQTYTVDVSNGLLTLATSYAPRLFSEPVESDGKITKRFRDPSGGTMEFVGRGNGVYELVAPLTPCHYQLVK